jgi:hypothetical protein
MKNTALQIRRKPLKKCIFSDRGGSFEKGNA